MFKSEGGLCTQGRGGGVQVWEHGGSLAGMCGAGAASRHVFVISFGLAWALRSRAFSHLPAQRASHFWSPASD